jgi:hypothetical protein
VTGTFTLADLAGSENAALAGDNRAQAAQGSGINVGLSVLASVIDDVARSGRSVRYRDSKLTFSLRGALGGAGDGARALFMACVSPAAAHAERSKRTLATATRAARIENSVARHVSAVAAAGAADAAEREALRAQVAQLALELAEARAELAACPPSAAAAAAADPVTAPAGRPSAATPMLVLPAAEVEALRRAAEEQRDRADALGVVLREADRRHAALTAQLAAAGGARASPGPALAALEAAPILAAARGGGADSDSDGEGFVDDGGGGGDGAPDAAAVAAAVPMLSLDEVCLAADESSLALLQRGVLRELAGRRLAEGAAAARRAEVAALRLAVRAYNACAGEAEAGRAAAAELLHQAAEEKVRYVRLSASYQASPAASLAGQSRQKPPWKPTDQPTNQLTNQQTTNYRPLPKINQESLEMVQESLLDADRQLAGAPRGGGGAPSPRATPAARVAAFVARLRSPSAADASPADAAVPAPAQEAAQELEAAGRGEELGEEAPQAEPAAAHGPESYRVELDGDDEAVDLTVTPPRRRQLLANPVVKTAPRPAPPPPGEASVAALARAMAGGVNAAAITPVRGGGGAAAAAYAASNPRWLGGAPR